MQRKPIQLQYKDRLFRRAFREREHLLALYNAVNGSSYENPEDLEIRTLEDVIYLGVKDDVSFILDYVLGLYEHQSSFNPNMPARGVSYFASLYQNYMNEHNINVYSSRLQRLPFPQYIVFYNGTREEPDRKELRLSDAFLRGGSIPEDREPCLEVKAIMLNINWGHNQELMEQCQRLREYSQCIATIREYEARISDREEAMARAVDQCIEEGLLADILSKNKAEVVAMFLTEYDAEKQRRLDRLDAREEGLIAGQGQKLVRIVRKMVLKGRSAEDIVELLEEPMKEVQNICDAVQSHPQWTEEEVFNHVYGKLEPYD